MPRLKKMLALRDSQKINKDDNYANAVGCYSQGFVIIYCYPNSVYHYKMNLKQL